MDIKEILSRVDHTNLAVNAKWSDIQEIIDDGIRFGTASVCIPPSYVKRAAEYAQGRVKICTVIGFPNGYMTTAPKCFEAEDAIKNGADEIDMVINVGLVKDKEFNKVEEEIKALKRTCGDRVLKVIVETCLLTDEEKVKMCQVVSSAGADYIKTSTGFGGGGATFEDVALFKRNVSPSVKIKAAGGISSIDDAKRFIELGADRLGTSRIVKIVKEGEANDGKTAY